MHRYRSIVEVPSELPRLLGHLGTGWVRGAAHQVDPMAAELDETQHIQRFQPDSLDCEEVAGDDLVLVVRQKGAPRTALLAAFRGWRDVLALEHSADDWASDVIAVFAQFALQLAVAPARVLLL